MQFAGGSYIFVKDYLHVVVVAVFVAGGEEASALSDERLGLRAGSSRDGKDHAVRHIYGEVGLLASMLDKARQIKRYTNFDMLVLTRTRGRGRWTLAPTRWAPVLFRCAVASSANARRGKRQDRFVSSCHNLPYDYGYGTQTRTKDI